MKEKDGQYIPLNWDGSYPEAYYIKGHVTKDAAYKTLQHQEGLNPDDIAYVKHKYARWGFSSNGDYEHQLNVYDNTSRGAFKVTECEPKQ